MHLTQLCLLTFGRFNPFDHLFVLLMAPMVYGSAVWKWLVVNAAFVCTTEGSLLFLRWRQLSVVNLTSCKDIGSRHNFKKDSIYSGVNLSFTKNKLVKDKI